MAKLEQAPTVPLTVELSEPLVEKLNSYLKENPAESLEGILQEALRIRTFPRNPAKILELAGVVPEALRGASEHAEDFPD